jgi:hypothetical protein
MQRGSKSIFSPLFTEEAVIATASESAPPGRKGRSQDLIDQRNQLLFSRYYYYAKIIRKQYPDILLLLRQELFIEQRTIIDTLQRHNGELQQLRQQNPDVKYFRHKYPWLVWQAA